MKRVDPDETRDEPLFEDFSTEVIIRERTSRSVRVISGGKEDGQAAPGNSPTPFEGPVPDITADKKRVFIDTIIFDREKTTRVVSHSDRQNTESMIAEAEKASFEPVTDEPPKLIIDTLEEPVYDLPAKQETMKLVIDTMRGVSYHSLTRQETVRLTVNRGEATPSGYFVHHTRQPLLSAPVEEAVTSSGGDKTTSILAGFGVVFFILLVSVLVTIAPLIAGVVPSAGQQPVQPADGAADPFVQDLPFAAAPMVVADPSQAVDPGAGSDAGSGDPGFLPGLFTNSATSLIDGSGAEQGLATGTADSIAPLISEATGQTPQSYVTLQPVPVVSSTPLPDLGAALPVMAMDNYFTIYSMENQEAQTNYPYVLFDLDNPPLVINYAVTPMSSTDVKMLDYKIMATEHHDNVTINRPYEQSWFSIIVRDNATGTIVAEDGYGKSYAQESSPKDLALYKAGTYRFEFTGSHAVVNLTMKVKKEGNIE